MKKPISPIRPNKYEYLERKEYITLYEGKEGDNLKDILNNIPSNIDNSNIFISLTNHQCDDKCNSEDECEYENDDIVKFYYVNIIAENPEGYKEVSKEYEIKLKEYKEKNIKYSIWKKENTLKKLEAKVAKLKG